MSTVRSLTLVFGVFLVACSDGFEPYSELSSLRVLAVASQPAVPRAGVTASLRALVYAPPAKDVTYRWSLCPVVPKAKDAYACPVTPEAAAAVFGAGLPQPELGSMPEVTLSHGLAPSTLAALCGRGIAATGYADSVDCDLGFPVTVVLDVSTGDQSLRAAFVVYLPTSDDPSADNHNPALVDLTANGVPIGDALVASPAEELAVAAAVSADAVESRPAFPFESGTERRSERLTFSWFADTGSWNKDRTSFIDGETSLADASANPWTAPDVLPASATFAVVVRDDRGGVGWLQRRPSLGGQP